MSESILMEAILTTHQSDHVLKKNLYFIKQSQILYSSHGGQFNNYFIEIAQKMIE